MIVAGFTVLTVKIPKFDLNAKSFRMCLALLSKKKKFCHLKNVGCLFLPDVFY